MRTIQLQKAVESSEIVEFPLYQDAEIGLFEDVFVKMQIAATIDEDLDTDEDVLINAKNCCSRDFLQTKQLLPQDKYERDKLI